MATQPEIVHVRPRPTSSITQLRTISYLNSYSRHRWSSFHTFPPRLMPSTPSSRPSAMSLQMIHKPPVPVIQIVECSRLANREGVSGLRDGHDHDHRHHTLPLPPLPSPLLPSLASAYKPPPAPSAGLLVTFPHSFPHTPTPAPPLPLPRLSPARGNTDANGSASLISPWRNQIQYS